MNYTVVIPVYNEGKTVGSVLNELKQCFKEKVPDYEIIVVNDG